MVLELRVTFKSDWHIGTGVGRPGEVDALIARDGDDYPCIPAKSLTGVLRDAAENLARELGNDWPDLVNEVFGDQPGLPSSRSESSPRPSAISVRLARLSDAFRSALSDTRLRQNLTIVRSSTSIDAFGVARDDNLRSIEVARAGLQLTAPVRLEPWWSDEAETMKYSAAKTVEYFIAAAARLVESVGGRRRRGLGNAEVRLFRNGVEVVPVDGDWSAALPVNPPPSRTNASDSRRGRLVSSATQRSHEGGVTTRLMVTALSPLLLASEVRGNQWSTVDYIGGNLLLPIVHRALVACGVDAEAAIRHQHVIVRRGNPALDDERLLPAPFIFEEEKGNKSQPWKNSRDIEISGDKTAGVYKPVRGGWVGENGLRARGVAVEERAHNTIDDTTQSTDTAGLYSYRVVAAHQTFASELWLSDALHEEIESSDSLLRELSTEHSVGRSKKDDYGRVRIEASPLEASPLSDRRSLQPVGSSGTEIEMWCGSDVLLLNSALRQEPTAELLTETVARTVGVRLRYEAKRSAIRTRRLDSWSAAWSLPRHTLSCISAGSVVVASLAEPSDIQLPPRIAVGERRTEGFGEILLNNPLLARGEIPLTGESQHRSRAPMNADLNVGQPVSELTDHETGLLDELARLATISAITRKAEEIIKSSEGLQRIGWDNEKPTNSQIGKIRAWLRSDNTEMPNSFKRNFDPQVHERLQKLLSSDEVWNLLGKDCIISPTTWSNDQTDRFRIDLRRRAVQILVETAHQHRTRGGTR